VTVSGAPLPESFSFVKGSTDVLTFSEKGLPSGQSWCVELSGDAKCSTGSSLSYANLTPATYGYAVVSPTAGQTITAKVGSTVIPNSGSMSVSKSTKVALTYSYPFTVTFTESGLPTGALWSVTIDKVTKSSTNSTITFSLPNGTYSYKVGAETGYSSSGAPSKATVNGAPLPVAVTFKAKT